MHVVEESIDNILMRLISAVMTHGYTVAPRGLEVKELIGVVFELRNPRRRIQYNPVRKMNVHFALGEFLWYFSGSNLLDDVSYYNKGYIKYSDDGVTLHGAYGKRIFASCLSQTGQWNSIKELLKRDRNSRQAVISIYSASDILVESKDIPCTCTMQFFIRNGVLDMIVYMRSNDLIWGTPYDVFSFTLLQEIMANELGVGLGRYIHCIGSAHIYSYHFELSESILRCGDFAQKEMKSLDLVKDEEVWEIIRCAKHIREKKEIDKLPGTQSGQDIVAVLVNYARKYKDYCGFINVPEIPEYMKIESLK